MGRLPLDAEELWGDVGRYGEMWGDVGRYREMAELSPARMRHTWLGLGVAAYGRGLGGAVWCGAAYGRCLHAQAREDLG